MKIEVFTIGPVETNCYFVTNEETKELVIIDPAVFQERLLKKVQGEGLKPVAILLTHGHFDHIMGVPGWKKEYPDLPLYAGKAEERVLFDPSLNLSNSFREYAVSLKPEHLLEDGEEISLIGETFRYILTPGHTEGSGCYYDVAEKVLFSGDTLFYGSMGRTDLVTGDEAAIFASLRRLMELPDDTAVFPGHGPDSMIGTEKRINPYVR